MSLGKKKNKQKNNRSYKKNEKSHTNHSTPVVTSKDVNDVALFVFGSLYKSSF